MEIPWENSYEATVTKELNRILGNQRPYWYEKIFGNVIQFTPYPTAMYFFYIDELFFLKLNQLVLAYSCSLLVILFAAFSLLFYQVRNSEFIRICTPSSLKRISDEWSSVIGWMTAEVIVCQQLDPGRRIDHFLQDVTESLASADEYQSYPFENLLKDLNFPIHITAPVFLNMMRDKNDIIKDFRARHHAGGSAIFEFDCAILECRNGIRFRTTYNTDAYTQEKIEGMFKKYFGLLRRLVDSNKNDTLSDIMR
jgi:non-ribosomal peptide synthetase component F